MAYKDELREKNTNKIERRHLWKQVTNEFFQSETTNLSSGKISNFTVKLKLMHQL